MVDFSNIKVTVTDTNSISASQTFSITVASSSTNQTPTITSTAPTSIALGQKYLYQVTAGDADGDVLTYSLTTAPSGMTVNSTTGLISWTPTASQFGSNTATVQVSDGRNGAASQTFTVKVTSQATNQPPVITSTPPLGATVGQLYSYNLTGYDPDNDPVFWNLVGTGSQPVPAGMSLDANLGTLRWPPLGYQVGNQSVTVQLVDAYGASTSQSWTIAVHGVNLPPVALI
jgi:hypothetical protein